MQGLLSSWLLTKASQIALSTFWTPIYIFDFYLLTFELPSLPGFQALKLALAAPECLPAACPSVHTTPLPRRISKIPFVGNQ